VPTIDGLRVHERSGAGRPRWFASLVLGFVLAMATLSGALNLLVISL